jgi:hypothetical protein
MALELRGSKFYYYRKRRSGSQVRSTYVGAGAVALQAYEADIADRRRRQTQIDNLKRQTQIDSELDAVAKKVARLIRETLQSAGFHSHKGQWRQRRK